MSEKIHEITGVKPEKSHLVLVVDGQAYRVNWSDCSPLLAKASVQERAYIEVSPSGYGLHWPLIDEDLAISPLLDVATPVAVESLR